MNDNQGNQEEPSEYRKTLDDWKKFQQGIIVNLTDVQVRDLENSVERTIAHIVTERLRRITNDKEYLTRKQAREYLSITDEVLQRWIKNGLPYIEVDDVIRFYRSDMDAWLANFVVLPEIDKLDAGWDTYGYRY